MVEEESDDTEAVLKLLELNDIINTIIEKYTLVKKGNINAAKALPTVAPDPGTSNAPVVEDSLIDLGGDVGPTNGPPPTPGPSNANSLQDDLLGLSIDDPNASIGQGGGIALGFGANTGRSTVCLCQSYANGDSRHSGATATFVDNAVQYRRPAAHLSFPIASTATPTPTPTPGLYVCL
jgi:ADP-ribosylation factor-binding protein GGA